MVTLPNGLDGESGYATNVGSISGMPYDPAEQVPELFWPNSIYVYDRMRRGDPQLNAILNAIFLPLLRAPWHIDPNGASDAATNLVAADLGLPILGQDKSLTASRRAGSFNWADHLRQALLFLPYGFMGFEIIADTGRGDGLAHLARLSPRMPLTIGRMDVNRSGDLVAVHQYPTTVPTAAGNVYTGEMPTIDKDTGMVRIGADRLVWYVNGLEGAAWQGVSILRSCYGAWLLKQRALKVNAIKDERTGMGVPWIENAPGTQDLAPGQKLATQLRGGEQAGGSLPPGSKLHIEGVSGQVADILASINYYDEAMSRAMLTQFLNLGTTKTGSRALGDSFIDFFKLALDGLADNIVQTATAQIIDRLVTWNFGENAAAPRLVTAEVDLETDLPPDSLVALASAGVLTNDAGLESYTRERFNLPPLDGPGRPIMPPKAAFSLSGQPVTARRRRDVKAKASGSKADALSEADRARTAVEQAQRAVLGPAWVSMVSHIDVARLISQTTGIVLAAADPASGFNWEPYLTPAVLRELEGLKTSAAGQRVDSVISAAVQAGYAQGDVQARMFMNVTERLTPLPPYDAARAVGDWWDDTLGATSRRLGQVLSDALGEADSLNRDDLLTLAENTLDDTVDAEFYLDEAISWSLSEGSMQRYGDAGVAQVEWLTAEDTHVDEVCLVNEANGPYPLQGAPTCPAHVACRCAYAPI
jgi:hypothetical protein